MYTTKWQINDDDEEEEEEAEERRETFILDHGNSFFLGYKCSSVQHRVLVSVREL